jgi:valyl-tRNA synthetase
MDKQYNHKTFEDKIYQKWEEEEKFSPTEKPGSEPYTIMMPPPNANDPLHVGHAMFVTVEDILIRYQRMNGRAALWLPGTDHAGIETQFVFEKKLKKEGKSRFNFDRETLYKMIWDYVIENSAIATEQLKKIGASADWSRFKFMLDKDIVEIVLKTFKQMADDGLVYRSEKLVNYCTKCGTAFSELEVDHEEVVGKLYFVKYRLVNDKQNKEKEENQKGAKDEEIVVATTRPETIFADTAIAINPNHPKAYKYSGKKAINPLNGAELPIIFDEAVDVEFGTGALKITPFHDQTDFEIWERHKDKMSTPKCVVGMNGKLTTEAGEFSNLKVHIAKPMIIKKLEDEDRIEKIENHPHTLGLCYRCGTIIEPLPLSQFFIKVKPLTEKVLKTIDEGEVKVYGAGYDKILRHWLENLKDWNVSRQVVWGIRMPVWYNVEAIKTKDREINADIKVAFINKKGELISGEIDKLLGKYSLSEIQKGLQSLQAPKTARYVISTDSPGVSYIQETDTFDTWFSSAQWPYTTLMTGKDGDLKRFYPTQVMETGYDILPFWVMRMLMMGIYKTGKAPFSSVYLHGLVRDEQGQKMSKSKGNVTNPIEVIDKYGADALRMALVMSTSAGKDSNTGENKIRGMRNFTNKIWNAARFVMINQENNKNESEVVVGKLDKEFNKKLDEVSKSITNHLESFRIGLAAEEVYNQFWHWYCDEMIEQSKNGDLSNKALISGLVVFLKLLHPFVPFVTEAVYDELKKSGLIVGDDMLITSSWPKTNETN